MEIYVKAWGEVVGKLKDIRGLNKFSLNPDNPLDFSPIKLKEKNKTYDFSHLNYQSGLPGMINDSLPGVYGKEYLDEFFIKHFKFKPSYLETLQFLGDNTMGALTFEPKMILEKTRENAILDAKSLYAETKKALLGESSLSINEVIAISNSAASGARPKAIVGFNPTTSKIYVGKKHDAMPEGFVHSLIKFDNLIFKDSNRPIEKEMKESLTKTEYVYSLLAREAGLKMAPTHLIEADGHTHFVTERFDIGLSSSGELERKHMHSLSGIMHQNPSVNTFDYTNLFRVGEKLNIPHKDKEQMFKNMTFNLIFGNKDDHTRNFSYLMDKNGKWRSAPPYDITFTQNKKHQMLFNYKNGSIISLKDLEAIANDFQISNCKETIEMMLDLKHERLPEFATQYGMKEWGQTVINVTAKVLAEAYIPKAILLDNEKALDRFLSRQHSKKLGI